MAIEFSSFEKDLFEVTQSRDASARSPLSWSLSAGGFEDDVVTGIATSSDGSIYVAGNFIENIMFGDEGGLQDYNTMRISSSPRHSPTALGIGW